MTIARSIIKTFKISFVLALVFNALSGKAQDTCAISIDTQMPVCPETYFELSVFERVNQTFDWQQEEGSGFVSVGNESVLAVKLNDSATFKVIVRDTITNQVCESELFGVSVYPPIHIEFVQIRLTCTNGDTINGRTAQVRATASGAFQPDEYHYFWEYPAQIIGDSSLALGLKGHQNYAIAVKDRYGCVARDTFYTQVYPNPVIEIFTDPNDTVYLQNPSVTYSYNNLSIDSIALSTHSWEIIEGDTVFTSELEAPVYRYNSTGEFMAYLTVVNPEGCDTTYATTVTVKPVELYIPNVFTPGTSPGVNDFFEVTTKENQEKGTTDIETLQRFYENSRLVVFNRLGKKVFEADNYDNKWDGDNLPDGVYYYVLECHGAKSTDVFKGSVTIIRGN